MLNFIENVLVTIFSVLPDADSESSIIEAVNNAFYLVTPAFAKINLIFPIYVLFKILIVVLFVELALFLFSLVMKTTSLFKP